MSTAQIRRALAVVLDVAGVTLIIAALWHMWPPLSLITVGVVLLALAASIPDDDLRSTS